MKRSKHLPFVLVFSITACADSEEAGDPGAESSESSFSYDGETGPDNWHELSEDYLVCEEGGRQSPVALPGEPEISDLPDLQFDYGQTSVKLSNTGHGIKYTYEPGSTLELAGVRYELLQFHFHAQSEHSIDDVHYPLEMHLVHRSLEDENELLVVGVMVEEGDEAPVLTEALWSQMPAEAGEEVIDTSAVFSVTELVPEGPSYRYGGSLTTPPCTENVEWVVMSTPISFSAEQIATYTSVYEDNARPTADLGEREVSFGH